MTSSFKYKTTIIIIENVSEVLRRAYDLVRELKHKYRDTEEINVEFLERAPKLRKGDYYPTYAAERKPLRINFPFDPKEHPPPPPDRLGRVSSQHAITLVRTTDSTLLKDIQTGQIFGEVTPGYISLDPRYKKSYEILPALGELFGLQE